MFVVQNISTLVNLTESVYSVYFQWYSSVIS